MISSFGGPTGGGQLLSPVEQAVAEQEKAAHMARQGQLDAVSFFFFFWFCLSRRSRERERARESARN